MNWSKIKCRLFGHDWQYSGYGPRWAQDWDCARCGDHCAGYQGHVPPRAMPEPTRPAPPMPECKSPKVDIDRIQTLSVKAGDTVVVMIDRTWVRTTGPESVITLQVS